MRSGGPSSCAMGDGGAAAGLVREWGKAAWGVVQESTGAHVTSSSGQEGR